jgi:hypothetical protein
LPNIFSQKLAFVAKQSILYLGQICQQKYRKLRLYRSQPPVELCAPLPGRNIFPSDAEQK